MSTKNSRRTNAPTGFAELAKRMNLTYQPAEKPSMQLIRPFPGGGTTRPVAAVRFVPDRPASGSGRISRTVGHARGIPDKNRRNQRVNLLNIYPTKTNIHEKLLLQMPVTLMARLPDGRNRAVSVL